MRLLYSYSLTLCSYYKERQILAPRPYILPPGRLGQQGLSNHRCQTPRISRAFLPRRVQWNSLMESFPTQGRTRLGRKARLTNTHRCKLLHYSAEILILIRYTSKFGNFKATFAGEKIDFWSVWSISSFQWILVIECVHNILSKFTRLDYCKKFMATFAREKSIFGQCDPFPVFSRF